MAKTAKRTPPPPSNPTGSPARNAAGAEMPPGSGLSPDPDRVARRAYELYQARGESDGGALEDWLAAEQELNRPAPDRRDE
jgi:hypothetical protein